MAPEQLLAIDAGTQSVRALIFDLQGNMIARSRVVIEPYFFNGSRVSRTTSAGLLGCRL